MTVNRSPSERNLIRAPGHMTGVCRRVFTKLSDSPRELLGIFSRNSGSRVIMIESVPVCSVYRRRLLPFVNGTRVTCVPTSKGIVKLSGLTEVISSFTGEPRLRRHLASRVTSFLRRGLSPGNITIIIRTRRLYVAVHKTETTKTAAFASTLHNSVQGSTEAHTRMVSLLEKTGWDILFSEGGLRL